MSAMKEAPLIKACSPLWQQKAVSAEALLDVEKARPCLNRSPTKWSVLILTVQRTRPFTL